MAWDAMPIASPEGSTPGAESAEQIGPQMMPRSREDQARGKRPSNYNKARRDPRWWSPCVKHSLRPALSWFGDEIPTDITLDDINVLRYATA